MLAIFLLACLAVGGNAAPAGAPLFSRESIEWCDIWMPHADENKLPRVLLIGDSISRDYFPGVEKHLAGKAYVDRLSTSAFISDPVLLQEIKMVLSACHFDVIHFNNGMHGWQHSETEYKKAFPKFLETIREYAPHAKLIWATTTPLKISPKLPPGKQTEATDQRIEARNAIALSCIQAAGIPEDDLYELVRGHPEYHSDNIHFNSHGIGLEAAQVASEIEKQLNR